MNSAFSYIFGGAGGEHGGGNGGTVERAAAANASRAAEALVAATLGARRRRRSVSTMIYSPRPKSLAARPYDSARFRAYARIPHRGQYGAFVHVVMGAFRLSGRENRDPSSPSSGGALVPRARVALPPRSPPAPCVLAGG